MSKRRFLANSVLYTLSGFLPAASTILLLPIYLTGLSTDQYGSLAVYLSFGILAQVLTMFSFDSSLYIHYHEYKNDWNKLSKFISVTFLLMILLAAGTVVVLGLTGQFVLEVFFKDKSFEFFPWGILAILSGALQGIVKVYTNLLQSKQQSGAFFILNVVLFSLMFTLTWGGLRIFPETFVGPVAGRFVALLLTGLFVLITVFKTYGFHRDFTVLTSSLSFNIYAFIYQILQWTINYFDRIFLTFYLALNYIGVYDFALKCLLMIELIVNGVHGTIYPKVLGIFAAQQTKSTTEAINFYYYLFNGLIIILVTGAMLVLPLVVDYVPIRAEYKEAIPYFPIIAVVYLFKGMRLYFSLPYAALRDTKQLPLLYVFVFAVKLGTMLLLISKYQLYGAVIGTLAAYGTEVVLLYRLSANKMNLNFNAIKLVYVPLVVLGLILVVEILKPGTDFTRHFCYFAGSILLIGVVYKTEFLRLKE